MAIRKPKPDGWRAMMKKEGASYGQPKTRTLCYRKKDTAH